LADFLPSSLISLGLQLWPTLPVLKLHHMAWHYRCFALEYLL
jgi:hypothetical protein